MKLGAFSISLNVKDIHISKSFYESLGFEVFAGEIENKWLIMKCDDTIIGLFQGMFENNIMTFNPGWNQDASESDYYDDIRKIQAHLKEHDVQFINQADETTKGPASFMIEDPDGNVILFDQHR